MLALFASGRTRGLALEVGGGVAHAVPVFEGFALNHAVLRLEGAGQDITHRLKLMLEERGHHLSVSRLVILVERLRRGQMHIYCHTVVVHSFALFAVDS